MTHRTDEASGRDVIARWCILAEQRLEHLAELFESGRWRRYHTEKAFLENIREARVAVETWRGLAGRNSPPDKSSADDFAFGHPEPALSGPSPETAAPVILFATGEDLPELPVMPEDELDLDEEMSPAFALDESAFADALSAMPEMSSIEQRYPLLRNAL